MWSICWNTLLFWGHFLTPISPSTWDNGSNTVVLFNRYFKLRLFPALGKIRRECVVFFPPYAGRDGTVCNALIQRYQSLGYNVYVFELLSAFPCWNNAVSLEMLRGFAKECYRFPKQPKKVVGVCMGGWLSLLAVKGEKEKPLAQYVSAFPFDMSQGESAIKKSLESTPSWFLWLPVVLTGVNPAWLQWWRFTMAYDPAAVFIGEPTKLYDAIAKGDTRGIKKYHRNRNWFYNPRSLGWWFLEAVDQIFIQNRLKEMIDQYDWPVFIYAGKEDEIVSWQQTVELANYVKKPVVKVFPNGGHTLTFNGAEQLNQMETDILSVPCEDELSIAA